MKRRISMLSAMLLVVGGLIVASANPAAAAGAGSVTCFYDNNEEVGVWVSVSGGTSGWATRWDNGYGGEYYSYYEIDNGKTHQLHVGCGGDEVIWGTTFYTPWTTGYNDWICTAGYNCYPS